MAGEPARVSIAAMPAVVGVCDLCAADPAEMGAAVLISHERGGSVRFNACERCAQAMRRLLAAIGGHGIVIATPESTVTEPHPVANVAFVRPPELIGTVPDGFTDPSGRQFIVRLYGDERADGTWIGWIEFEATATAVTLRTGRETTQSNREQLSYWASGLESTYFDGAFARAR
jgi:hypothetical protein